METITVSYTYTLTHQLDDTYYFTKDKRCFNVKRGIEVKKILNNSCVGFCINRKFIALSKMNLIPINKNIECPF